MTSLRENSGTSTGNLDISRLLMPPPASKPLARKLEVLEEDEYLEKLEGIVERDYFPQVPKMRNQLEWLQAVKTGDPVAIRHAQLNIARRRAGLKTPARSDGAGQVGASILTTPRLNTPALTPVPHHPETASQAAAGTLPDCSLRAPKVSLDQFLATHTSEDNHSFKQIQNEETKVKRIKYAHHFEDKNNPQLLEGPFPTDGFGTTGQTPGTLVTWKHVAKNTFFFDTSQQNALLLTTKEVASQVQGAPKQIVASNTRLGFEQTPGDAQQDAGSTSGNQQLGQGNTQATGYNYLSTPNITPGVDASPFITWGEIEGTPVRLEMEDIPIQAQDADGPQFRMAATPKRELVLRSLAVKGSRGRGSKGGTSMLGVEKGSTPLSTAAARLVTSVGRTSKAADADAQLRASYSSIPGHRSATPGSTPMTTPLRTPLGRKHQQGLRSKATPSQHHMEKSTAPGAHITDDLLQL